MRWVGHVVRMQEDRLPKCMRQIIVELVWVVIFVKELNHERNI